MKNVLVMRISLVLTVLGLTTPMGLARSEVYVGTAGPLVAVRTGAPLGWRIKVLNGSDSTYSVLYMFNGEVERKLIPAHKTTNVGYVLAREIPTFRFAGIRRVEAVDGRKPTGGPFSRLLQALQ